MKAKFKTGDIIRIPMYEGFFLVTNDNTNKGGYGPGSIELCCFPDMHDIFYRLPCHLHDARAKKVS